MHRKTDKNVIIALDIGTSKIAAIVGLLSKESSDIEIIGVGVSPSFGMKKGIVVDIELTVQSIQKAIEDAELMSGYEITSVDVGIAGSHIKSHNSDGTVAVKDHEVSSHDVQRVIDTAKTLPIHTDQKILHVLPQEYIIDHQEGIKEPIGMSGIRLEAKVHVVTGSVSAIQNIIKCVNRCNLKVDNIVLEQLASSYAVLTDDERSLGVCLIDIGGGTTDIAIYTDSFIRHTSVIPVAGDQVTNDIAVALRTPTSCANKLKIEHACALRQLVNMEDTIEVPGVADRGDRRLSKQTLAEVVEPRYEELFTLIQKELRHSGYEELVGSGIVITGGASKILGAVELAEEIFHMPVRIGKPRHISGIDRVIEDPIYATGVGLLLYKKQLMGMATEEDYENKITEFIHKIKSWLHKNF